MREMYNEQWRAVKGFEGRYAVSDMGRVKSLNYHRTGREQILKPIKRSDGYLFVNLSKNGIKKPHLVHRLVAEAFIPNPDPEKYDIINHKIEGVENRSINTVDNLEWCDIPYNLNYGTARERTAKAKSKRVYQYTTAHELIKEWQSVNEAERQMGRGHHISDCCNGKIKTAYGFIWSYTLL